MNWLILSILATATYSTSNFIDKYILSRLVKNYLAMAEFSAAIAFIFGTVFGFLAAGRY